MFTNRQQLSDLIDQVIEETGCSMLDALVHISEKYKVEEEVIAAYIRQSHKLKDRLRTEAIALRMVNE